MESERTQKEINEDRIEQDVEERTDDRRAISYTKRQRLEKEKINEIKYQKAQDLFFKYQEFYDANYPRSTNDIEWSIDKAKINIPEGNFEETLNKMSELELYNILVVLDYGRKENFSGDMKEHYEHINARALITTRIPGFREQEKLKKFKEDKRKQEKIIQDLESTIKQKKIEFAKAHGEKVEEAPKTNIFICEICGFEAAKGSGLASHKRSKHPENKEKKMFGTEPSGTLPLL
jgi:hypothetical protein